MLPVCLREEGALKPGAEKITMLVTEATKAGGMECMEWPEIQPHPQTTPPLSLHTPQKRGFSNVEAELGEKRLRGQCDPFLKLGIGAC